MAWNPEDRDKRSIAERNATISQRFDGSCDMDEILGRAERKMLDDMELILPAIPTQDLLAELARRVRE